MFFAPKNTRISPQLAGQNWKRDGGAAFLGWRDFLMFPLLTRAMFWIPALALAQLCWLVAQLFRFIPLFLVF